MRKYGILLRTSSLKCHLSPPPNPWGAWKREGSEFSFLSIAMLSSDFIFSVMHCCINFSFLIRWRLRVTSHGLIVDSMHMSEVVCVLCAVKVNDKASTVDLRGQTSFPVELSCRLSLQSVTAMMHVWFPYLHKLKGKSPWRKISRQKRKTSSKILEMTVNQRNLCLYP